MAKKKVGRPNEERRANQLLSRLEKQKQTAAAKKPPNQPAPAPAFKPSTKP